MASTWGTNTWGSNEWQDDVITVSLTGISNSPGLNITSVKGPNAEYSPSAYLYRKENLSI